MKTFEVLMRGTAYTTLEVEAETREEAQDKAAEMEIPGVDEWGHWEVYDCEEQEERPATPPAPALESVSPW